MNGSSADAVLITGATRGIGRACAELLHGRGFKVVGLARGGAADAFPGDLFTVDLGDRSETEALMNRIGDRYDWAGLVNNAGAVGAQRLDEISLDTVDHVFQVNLGAAIICARACIPAMRRRRHGRIVNVSSELALGLPTRTAYGGAKAALISMTRTWALELAPARITVNAIAPGPVETDLFLRNNPPGSAEYERKLSRIPLGRLGQPVDIARAVGFLMSEDAAFVTGQTLFVDGGSSLAGSALF